MLKSIHILTALISIIFFNIRFIGHIRNARFMRQKWVHIAPHLNDSILLLSAILLALHLGQYPFTANWLTAKVLALLCYILLGMMALKWCRLLVWQVIAWLGAMLVFTYIVSVAISRDAGGVLSTFL